MMETQLILFDYNALDTDTRAFVETRTVEIKALVKRSAADIIEIGQRLIEVKARLGHGKFGAWLGAEFDWSERTARQFMQVSEKFKSANFADFSIAPSALYMLSAPSTPTDAFEEAIERAENGEHITYAAAKDIVSHHKEPPLVSASEWQAPPQYQDLKDKLIANDRAVFICPTCNDIFDNEVWHCQSCDHHWPMSRDICHNCYGPQEHADGLKQSAETIDHKWTEDELIRRGYVEQGMTVIANMKTDLALIAWSKSMGIFERIDRATEWGNPFLLPTDGDRQTIVENYQWYLDRKPSLLNRLNVLQGKVLGCWCYPELCHGEVLRDYADDTAD